ncbi:MAG: PLDc N-terminal domain-containing protein [Nocardioidaceae bacterium]
MRLLPVILLIVLAIYCWIELSQSNPAQVRQLPRGLWGLIIAVPLVGPVAWLVYGRPNGTEVVHTAPKPRKSHTVAPDDDPDFLRSLRNRPPPDDDYRS